MSDQPTPPQPPANDLDSLRAMLREVTEQRDKLLAQYESMALQTDESTREIDDAQLQAKEASAKAEASERHAQEEKGRADQLSASLDAERRKSADLGRDLETERGKSRDLTAECARLRAEAAQVPTEEHPLAMLSRGATLLACQGVKSLRAKIPADSPMLPWFDRIVDWIAQGFRLATTGSIALWRWLKPHLDELWKLVQEKAKGATK